MDHRYQALGSNSTAYRGHDNLHRSSRGSDTTQGGPHPLGGVAEMRIEELSARVAVSTRNIRSYQERGLLPPPIIRGRTGFYTEGHVRRLELIRQLQDRHFSLESIRQVLDAWSGDGDIGDLLGFQRMISDPWAVEALVELTEDEIFGLFPEARDDPALVDEAVRLGLLARCGEGSYSSPKVLVHTGVALLRIGLSVRDIFALVGRLRGDTRKVAHHLVEVISRQLLEPVADGALEPERLHELTETTLDLRGMTIDAVRAFLVRDLDDAIDEALDAFRERIESRGHQP